MHADETGIIVDTLLKKEKKISFIQWVDTNRDSSIYPGHSKIFFHISFSSVDFYSSNDSLSLFLSFFWWVFFVFSRVIYSFDRRTREERESMKKEGNRLINLSFIEKKFQTFTYGFVYIHSTYSKEIYSSFMLQQSIRKTRTKMKMFNLNLTKQHFLFFF